MTSLAFSLFANPFDSGTGLWIFLTIGCVCMFVIFIPAVHWIDSQRKEREAFYKAETFRRMTEATGEGAKAAVEMMREHNRLHRLKQREGMKIGGLICVAVGIAMAAMFGIQSHGRDAVIGLFPGLIGLALLAYVFFFAASAE